MSRFRVWWKQFWCQHREARFKVVASNRNEPVVIRSSVCVNCGKRVPRRNIVPTGIMVYEELSVAEKLPKGAEFVLFDSHPEK